jgi:hypothetical protein
MRRRLPNYYIGLQIAIVLVSWLIASSNHGGIDWRNIYTQRLIIMSLGFLPNALLFYISLYVKPENKALRNVLKLTMPLAALVASLNIFWDLQDGLSVVLIFWAGYLFIFIFSLVKEYRLLNPSSR